MRITHIVSVLATCFLITACGKTAAPPQTPPASAAPPAAIQHEDPPAIQDPDPPKKPPTAKKQFRSTVPAGWADVPEDEVLVNPEKDGMIGYAIFKTSDKTPKEMLVAGLANLPNFTSGKIQTSKDGLRAWTTTAKKNTKPPVVGKVVIRRIPQTGDVPADVTIVCFGTWPATENTQFSKDLDAYVDSFSYR